MNNFYDVLYTANVLRIGALILIGVPFIRWASHLLGVFCTKRFSKHIALLVEHFTFYGGIIFIIVTVLHELGFNVSAMLGAAGVLGVAIGFASQTSISNIISGFFLIIERPFSVGDVVKSGDIVGSVESVDLLSVRVRTLDNKLVRLPNETVLKQHLTNFTYYPIKRIDCVLSLPYTDNIKRAEELVAEVVARNSVFLKDPAPVVIVNKIDQLERGSAEIRIFLTVRVWVATAKFRSAPTLLMEQLKEQFDKNNSIITIVQINN